jgi:hypothetical protein
MKIHANKTLNVYPVMTYAERGAMYRSCSHVPTRRGIGGGFCLMSLPKSRLRLVMGTLGCIGTPAIRGIIWHDMERIIDRERRRRTKLLGDDARRIARGPEQTAGRARRPLARPAHVVR